jgi:membrane protein DedA with SNARE-associated domain
LGVVQTLLQTYGYTALILVLFLDSSGVPWPTEATLAAAGYFARSGHLNVFLAGVSGLAGAALGSALSYHLGRRMGPALMRRIMSFFRLSAEQIDKTDQWFAKHGHRAVFFGRMVPFVRNFTGYPAGVMQMPFGTYMLYSVAGYAVYSALALSLGYGGTALAQWLGDLELFLWLAIPLALLVLWVKWGRKWAARLRGR